MPVITWDAALYASVEAISSVAVEVSVIFKLSVFNQVIESNPVAVSAILRWYTAPVLPKPNPLALAEPNLWTIGILDSLELCL